MRGGFVIVASMLVVTSTVGAPDARAQEPVIPTNASGPTVDISDNPPIADSCGLDLTLVLDASGSIKSSNAVDDVREAAGQFLGALADTDSRARVTQFASLTEELAPSTLITSESVAPGGVHGEATTDYYNPIPQIPSGVDVYRYDGSGDPSSASNWDKRTDTQYTNWHASLKQAGEGNDEMVVYITDGEPTAYDFDRAGDPFGVQDPPDVGTVTNRGDADQEMLDRSVEAANAIKDGGTRMLAIGVGNATTSGTLQDRLKAISGPKLVDDLGSVESINDVDVAIVEDFEDLAQFLRSVVLQLCSPSLTITKLAQTPEIAEYTPAEGWSMTVTPTVATGFDWILPDTAATPSKTASTNENGTAQFQWEPTPDPIDSTADIVESFDDHPGYVPGRPGAVPDWSCELRDEFGNVRQEEGELVDTGSNTWGFTLDPIGQEVVACTVWNSFDYSPDIQLTKVNSPTSVRGDLTPAARVTSDYEVTNPGNTPLRGVDVADDQCDPSPVLGAGAYNEGDTNENGLLDPFDPSGETWRFRCDRPIRGQSTEPGGVTIVNNAVAIGFDPIGDRVTDLADDDVVAWSPLISLDKFVEGASFVQVDAGTEVEYTYEVTNTGNTPLGSIELDDDTPPCDDPGPVLDTNTDVNGDQILDPGEMWTYSCLSTVTRDVVNTARVTGIPLDPLNGNSPFPDPNPPVAAVDQAIVDIISADIVLEKSVEPELVVLDANADPEPVAYTYTVTNNGDAYLARPGPELGTTAGWIIDDTCGPVVYTGGDDGDGLLAPDPDGPELPAVGETWTFGCETTVDTTTVNIATIEAQPTDSDGTPLEGIDPVDDTAAAVVEVLVPEIIIEKIPLVGEVLDKDSTPVFGPDAPDVRPARYTYDVGNIGTVPLLVPADSPSDDKCAPLRFVGGDNNGNGLLDPLEVWTYRCDRLLDRESDSVPPPTGDESGTVPNTVVVEGIPVYQGNAYPGKTVTSQDDASVLVIEPGIDIVKTASRQVVKPGTNVTFTYVVSNSGDVGLELAAPIDDKCAPLVYEGGDNGDGLLGGANGSAEQWTYTCDRRVYNPGGDGTEVNTVAVGGFDPLGNLYVASDTASVRVIRPAIDLVKSVDRTLVPVGTRVTYTFDVTNVGTSPLAVDDALADVLTVDAATPGQPNCATPVFVGGDGNANGLLDREPAETWRYQCSAVIDEFTVDIALTTGLGGTDIDPDDPVRVFDRDSQAVDVFAPAIDVQKTAEPTELLGSGEVTYTYQVTNDGDVPLAAVAERITDDTCSPVTYVSGDVDGDGLLDTPNSIFEDAAAEVWTFRCTTTVSQTTENVVTVIGTPSDPGGVALCGPDAPVGRIVLPCDVTDDDTAVVTVTRPGTIIVEKRVHPAGSSTRFDFGLTGQSAFSLAGGETSTHSGLMPGEYSLGEVVPTGWGLYDLTCDDPTGNTSVDLGSGQATISLGEGEIVRCTYTNVKYSGIVIVKQTDVATSERFAFDADKVDDFDLGAGEQRVIADIQPGVYTVREAVPSSWRLTGLTCEDATGNSSTDLASGTATIDVAFNEIVTCTFTNSVATIIPPTGSNSTTPMVLVAVIAIVAGFALWMLGRPRRRA
jgi:uncharacterized repeat protein (TIGR01451 family)